MGYALDFGCGIAGVLLISEKNIFRSFRIIGLAKNSRQIFEFKGLIRKIFRNKDLAGVLPFLGRWILCGAGKLGAGRPGPEVGCFVFGYFVKDRIRDTANTLFALSSILTLGVKCQSPTFFPFRLSGLGFDR